MSEIVFPSTKAGNEVDRAVTAALSTIPGQITQIDTRVTALEEDVDDLSGLPAQVTQIGLKIGDLSQLETEDKTSTVSAINEVNEKVSNIASGKYYGFYKNASELPASGNENGYAYVGATAPYSIYNGVSNGGTMTWTDSGSKISSASVADEEDITQDSNGKLSLKDRGTTDGMGYIILRKNKTFASQVTQQNTIYEIRYDFDLDGATVTIPSGCVLKFNGGQLNNGAVDLSANTTINDGICNDVQFLVSAPNITILDTTIHNVNIGAPIVAWIPKSNLTIKGCDLRNESPMVEGESVSAHCNCIFLTLKKDIENVVIEDCTIAARKMCIEIYTYSQETLAVASKVAVRNNRLTQLAIDDPSVQTNACWPLSFSGNPNDSVIEGNEIIAGYYGIEIVHSNNITIKNNTIKGAYYGGIFITGTASNCSIIGNYIQDCKNSILSYQNTHDLTISGNTLINSTTDTSYNRVHLVGQKQNIYNNTIINGCILIEGSNNNEIRNNTFKNTSSTDVTPIRIANCNTCYITENIINTIDYYAISIRNSEFINVDANILNSAISGFEQQVGLVVNTYNIINNVYAGKSLSQDEAYALANKTVARPIFVENLPAWRNYSAVIRADGSSVKAKRYGSSDDDRPIANYIASMYGYIYFDRTEGKPFFAKNIYTSSGRVDWIEADGAAAKVLRNGTTAQRPSNVYIGFQFFDTTLGKPIYWDGTKWVDVNGYAADAKKKGTTSNRPTLASSDSGFQYYDTDLGKYICWNGTAWVNMDGSALS